MGSTCVQQIKPRGKNVLGNMNEAADLVESFISPPVSSWLVRKWNTLLK